MPNLACTTMSPTAMLASDPAAGDEGGEACEAPALPLFAASFKLDQLPGFVGLEGVGFALLANRPNDLGAVPLGMRWNWLRAWAKSTGLRDVGACWG